MFTYLKFKTFNLILLAVAFIFFSLPMTKQAFSAQSWYFKWNCINVRGCAANGIPASKIEGPYRDIEECKTKIRQMSSGRGFKIGSCYSTGSTTGSSGGGDSQSGAYQLGQGLSNLIFNLLKGTPKTAQQLAIKQIKKATKAQNKGDWLLAAQYWRGALKHINEPFLYSALGIALYNAGDYSGALRVCKRVQLRHRPSNQEQWLRGAFANQCLAMTYYKIGKYQTADKYFLQNKAYFTEAQFLTPEWEYVWKPLRANMYYFEGMNYFKQGDYNNALRDFDSALYWDPQNEPAAMGSVYAAEKLGDPERLEEALLLAHDIKPNYAMLVDSLARLMNDQERFSEAEIWYKMATELDPKNPHYPTMLSYNLKRQGKLAEAEKYALRAYKLDSNNDGSARLYGQILFEQGKYSKAIPYLEKAVKLNPGDVYHKWVLADTLVDAGDTVKAEKVFLEAIRQQPDFRGLHANYGKMLKDQGRNAEAINSFKTALALKPDISWYHDSLSEIYETDGRLDEALISARRALVLDPESEKKRARVASLETQTGAAPVDVLGIAAKADAASQTTFEQGQGSSSTSINQEGTATVAETVYEQAEYAAGHGGQAADAAPMEEARDQASRVFDNPVFYTKGTPGPIPVPETPIGELPEALQRALDNDPEYQKLERDRGTLGAVLDQFEKDAEKLEEDFNEGDISKEDYEIRKSENKQDVTNTEVAIAVIEKKKDDRKEEFACYFIPPPEDDNNEDTEAVGAGGKC